MGRSLSKKLRFEVLKRDGFTCQYCGQTPPTVILQIDHIIPVSKGGTNCIDNLVTSCFDCNQGKGAKELSAIPQTVQEKAKLQRELAKQLKEYNKFLAEIRLNKQLAAERIGTYWCDQKPERTKEEKGKWMVSNPRLVSIKRFLDFLPEVEIIDAVDIAFSRIDARGYQGNEKAWRYFCGICWNKIKTKKGDSDSEGGDQ